MSIKYEKQETAPEEIKRVESYLKDVTGADLDSEKRATAISGIHEILNDTTSIQTVCAITDNLVRAARKEGYFFNIPEINARNLVFDAVGKLPSLVEETSSAKDISSVIFSLEQFINSNIRPMPEELEKNAQKMVTEAIGKDFFYKDSKIPLNCVLKLCSLPESSGDVTVRSILNRIKKVEDFEVFINQLLEDKFGENASYKIIPNLPHLRIFYEDDSFVRKVCLEMLEKIEENGSEKYKNFFNNLLMDETLKKINYPLWGEILLNLDKKELLNLSLKGIKTKLYGW